MLGLRIGGSHNIDAEGTGTVRASVIAEQQENVGGSSMKGAAPWRASRVRRRVRGAPP
jgi:hypothetical protein